MSGPAVAFDGGVAVLDLGENRLDRRFLDALNDSLAEAARGLRGEETVLRPGVQPGSASGSPGASSSSIR